MTAGDAGNLMVGAAALIGALGAPAAFLQGWLNARRIRGLATVQQVAMVHDLVNSQSTALNNAIRTGALAQGNLEGRAEQAAERAAVASKLP